MTDLEAITDAALTAEREASRIEIERLLALENEDWRARYSWVSAELERVKAEEAAEDAAALAQAEADAEAIRQEAERVARLPGSVRFFRDGSSSFDTWTQNPSEAQRAWMRDHYHRMRVYSPYFDTRTAWFPNGIVYQDAYAVYVTGLTQIFPPWVLRDAAGAPLYIPYGARPYKQLAADITNPAFRADWIAQAKAKLAHGYRGLFVDDCNYYRKIARADGTIPASSPCFAGTLTDGVWRQAMALFMWQIRTELPDYEIVHNCVWSVNAAANELAVVGYPAADYVEIERGVNDTGITGGTGQFSLRALLDWVDRRHLQGVGVIWDSQASTDAQREYGLAVYFLTSDGRDMLGTRAGGTPGDWDSRYETQLGRPLDDRERLLPSGLLYRQFERGHVYVNEPGAAPQTFPGGRVLGPGSGAVVLDASIEREAA